MIRVYIQDLGSRAADYWAADLEDRERGDLRRLLQQRLLQQPERFTHAAYDMSPVPSH